MSFNWWAMQWGGESFNNAQTMCCEGSRGELRSSYNLSALRSHVRNGLELVFFRGFRRAPSHLVHALPGFA